jgi:hypothetical protein
VDSQGEVEQPPADEEPTTYDDLGLARTAVNFASPAFADLEQGKLDELLAKGDVVARAALGQEKLGGVN